VEPALDVSYDISLEDFETKVATAGTVKLKKVIVRNISCDGGQPISIGEFDLLVGDKMIRLKHIATDPEWLVLSQYA